MFRVILAGKSLGLATGGHASVYHLVDAFRCVYRYFMLVDFSHPIFILLARWIAPDERMDQWVG